MIERAKALASAVSGEALPYEYLNTYRPEKGMILANASAVGMQPKIDQTPVCKVIIHPIVVPKQKYMYMQADSHMLSIFFAFL